MGCMGCISSECPVVPMGKARIRVQVCATHTKADIDTCVAAFVTARDKK